MNKILYIILSLCFPVTLFAISLEGTWKSDKEKTLFWNSEYRKVSDEYLLNLDYLLGHHYLKYEDGKICSYFESFKIKDKTHNAYALKESRYKIVATNNHGFVVQESFSTGIDIIYMLVFDSNDSFYGVMLDTESYGQSGHREYYKRVTATGTVNWGATSCYPK